MEKELESMVSLIGKYQRDEISLQEAIELRRLSAEFTNICGEFVGEKFTQAYLFPDQLIERI